MPPRRQQLKQLLKIRYNNCRKSVKTFNMKKLFLVLALAATLQVFDAQAQKSPEAAKAAVEKAQAATTNPKQNTKAATWIKYGQTLLDAYNVPAGNLWLGMSAQELAYIGGGEKPVSEEGVTVAGQPMVKQTYSNKNLYFNQDGLLQIIEVTAPVLDGALESALEAFSQAAAVDAKGQKTKDIVAGLQQVASKFSEEAYNQYTFGNAAEASTLFEKAAEAAATAPLSQIDTNSVYNAAYTAWMSGNNDRAKSFFNKSIALGYAGTDGDAYAKLADIAVKSGDKAASKEYLEEGFSKYPQSQSILVGLINYYIESGEDTGRLFELLDEAKKNEPNNASLYYVEGNINVKLGNGDAAVAAYRKCCEINPNYEFGYIGEGVYFYNKAAEIAEKASNEMDDAKYMALMGEFENALKSCIAPFEKAFEVSKDSEVKVGVSEYLKNACYRFRTEDASYQEKYDKYAAYNGE